MRKLSRATYANQRILSASDADRDDPRRLIGILEGYARERILESKKELKKDDLDIYASGLRTPRLFLNFIDYLMWCEGADDFVFRYNNSIEHHHPQHDDKEQEPWSKDEIDAIGNLYLTSSSDNSAMNNNPSVGKVAKFRRDHAGAMPDNPKRNLMYNQTEEGGWTREKMQALTRDVKRMMEEFLSK